MRRSVAFLMGTGARAGEVGESGAVVPVEPVDQGHGVHRTGEQEALGEVAAELGEQRELFDGFDAFGDASQVEVVREQDQGRNDRGVVAV